MTEIHLSHAGEHAYTVMLLDAGVLRSAWQMSETELRQLSTVLVEKFPPHPALSFASLTGTLPVTARDLKVGQRFFRLDNPDRWFDVLGLRFVLECEVSVRHTVDGECVELEADETVRVQVPSYQPVPSMAGGA